MHDHVENFLTAAFLFSALALNITVVSWAAYVVGFRLSMVPFDAVIKVELAVLIASFTASTYYYSTVGTGENDHEYDWEE